jgi:hypothetical protein
MFNVYFLFFEYIIFIILTLLEFNSLELKYKIGVTLRQAVFLDHYMSNYDRINIYALDSFFIELVYDINYFNIISVNSFNSGNELDKYAVDFSKLL